MSNGHVSSRRQAYGRRRKELRARHNGELSIDLDGPMGWSRGTAWESRQPAGSARLEGMASSSSRGAR